MNSIRIVTILGLGARKSILKQDDPQLTASERKRCYSNGTVLRQGERWRRPAAAGDLERVAMADARTDGRTDNRAVIRPALSLAGAQLQYRVTA